MEPESFKYIKLLTLQAAEYLKNGEILICTDTLILRQIALDELLSEINIQKIYTPALQVQFRELLLWIQEYDGESISRITQLKNEQKDKLITQAKTAHAISKYKNAF